MIAPTIGTDPFADPTMMPVEPVVGDKSKVEALLKKLVVDELAFAKTATEPLVNDVNRLEREMFSCRTKRQASGKQAAERPDGEFDVPEGSNQVHVVHATFMENAFQNGNLYTVAPRNGALPEHAAATEAVSKQFLERNNTEDEVSRSLYDYIAFPMSCVKTCIGYENESESERLQIPNDPMAAAEVLAMADQSETPIREIVPPDPNGDPEQPALYEATVQKSGYNYYLKRVDVRCMAFGQPDTVHSIHQQPSVHEAHIWTLEQIEDCPGLKNVDQLNEATETERFPYGSSADPSVPGATANPTHKPHSIWESWQRVPWTRWVKGGEITQEDLVDFAAFYDIDPKQFAVPQLWEVWHTPTTEGPILKVRANYLKKKKRYPYEVQSFYDGSGLWGASYLQQILGECEINRALTNLFLENVRMRGTGGALIDTHAALDKDKLKQVLTKPRQIVDVELGHRAFDDTIVWVGEKVPDVSRNCLDGLGILGKNLQSYGTPAIMQGTGNADTATQDSINNARGQAKLNDPFRRFVNNVLKPSIENIIDLILMNMDQAELVSVIGEQGARLGRERWVTPDQIANNYAVQMCASFDFADRNTKSQQLIGLLNIMAGSGMVMPETFMKMVSSTLTYMGFTREQIDEYTNNDGLGTDPEDEIAVLINNPNAPIRVRPDDNHQMCLYLGQEAAAAYPHLMQQQNFMDYMRKHELYFGFQQQQAMMQQQAAAAPGGEGQEPKGPPVQPQPQAPTTQEGTEARQPGQMNSAPDQGMGVAAGLTGQGSLNATLPSRVKGEIAQGGN